MKTIKPFSTPGVPRRFLAALAAFACIASLSAFAQTADDVQPDMVTPPRLSVAEGDVRIWRPSVDAWEPAQINVALATGDSVNAGADATVELQVGPRDFVRMMANTMLTLDTHDAGMIHFRLPSGTATFDLRGGRAGQLVRIDADNANIVVGGRGYYRIATRDGETRLTVRNHGRATLTFADGRSRSVGAGEELVVQGNGERVDTYPAPAPDSWDRWNDARSEYYASASSNRYVPADVYGAADLDQYGSWREDRSYGWIWVPVVSSGWAPYSSGNWRWDPYYGWTWIDVAPWGWTTSHYGRWVFIGGGWAWAPGPRPSRVVYAPATVAFFRVDGSVSWVALGWGEPLVPWWGRPGFRGSIWWAGWGGPREHYDYDHHEYRNRRIVSATITVRDSEFDRQRIRGSTTTLAPGADLRPIRGDHPVRFGPDRDHRDGGPASIVAQPRDRRVEPGSVPRGITPRPVDAPAPKEPRFVPERPMQRPQVIIPSPRPAEGGLRESPRDQPREAQPERPRIEPRSEQWRSAPAPTPMAAPVLTQPRVVAPAPAPEIRREPIVPREMPRERRMEERVVPREMPRVETPRMAPQRMEPQRMEPQRIESPRQEARPQNANRIDRERVRPRAPGDRDER